MAKALLIEDELLLSEAIAEILHLETDLEVEVINDGQTAIARIQGEVADLVFLDLHLPRISGLDILNRIRSDTRWQKTPVVIMTADYLGAQQATIADHILMKPVDIDAILDLIAKLNLA